MTETQLAKQKLMNDFNEVVSDTEQLLKTVAGAGSEKTQALRASVEHSLQNAKARLQQFEREAVERTRATAKATDEYVHENPWRSVGIAAGLGAFIGLLVGLLLGRK